MSHSILRLYEIEYYEVDENKRTRFVTNGFNIIDAINALLDSYDIKNISRVQIYSIREMSRGKDDSTQSFDLLTQHKEGNE